VALCSGGTEGTLRVGILSDTHGHVCPNVLAVIADCDVAVHAGDIGSAWVLQQLRDVTGAVYAVRPRLRHQKEAPSSFSTRHCHIGSPLPGGSTLITSAP